MEPLSPRRAAAAAAFESSPFPRVTLDPPALVLSSNGTSSSIAMVEVSNAGGLAGEYHVCKDSVPSWMTIDGAGRGNLGPGEKAALRIVVDPAAAKVAARENGCAQTQNRPAACAVLRVEAEGGAPGMLLPVVWMVVDR